VPGRRRAGRRFGEIGVVVILVDVDVVAVVVDASGALVVVAAAGVVVVVVVVVVESVGTLMLVTLAVVPTEVVGDVVAVVVLAQLVAARRPERPTLAKSATATTPRQNERRFGHETINPPYPSPRYLTRGSTVDFDCGRGDRRRS
jgi:hypothetical protein